MPKKIRVMCVHGLGDQRESGWEGVWKGAIEDLASGHDDVTFEFRFVTYDPIFANTEISFAETMGALWKLGRSGAGQLFRRRRGLISDISDRVRWTAGYVVAWVEDDQFQKATRKLVLDQVKDFRPDVILAHSLGSLVTYNAFSHDDAKNSTIAKALKRAHYVTFGSQIGNAFVLGNLTHGRVQGLDVKHWHHLYNEHDDVFTAQLRLSGVSNFNQLLTPFDLDGIGGIGDHDATEYLKHSVTRTSFWQPLMAQTAGARAFGGGNPWDRALPRPKRSSNRRALLVGIDQYADEADRLYGCVNDVFSVSAALQDCGFEPDDIRTCLDHRATADGILSRLEWLVDDARDGDELVFYYSGHGARVPEYGANHEPDRLSETLVPYDFDWTPERSVSDEQIYDLYAQLPYSVQFLMIFDCCHSGGMHRESGARARGISPPDDIRHRELKWHRADQMWVERDFETINSGFSRRKGDTAAYFGTNGSTVRLGRAAALRMEDRKTYEKALAKSDGPVGPFLPLIVEACAEDELSYEYRHGATSYGAFTFCLTSILRTEKDITYADLVERSSERLKRLGYKQTPQILGPSKYLNAKVPFETGRGAENPAGR